MLYLHRVVLDQSEIDFFELHNVKGTQVARLLANFVEGKVNSISIEEATQWA
jgi:hypothetical protein